MPPAGKFSSAKAAANRAPFETRAQSIGISDIPRKSSGPAYGGIHKGVLTLLCAGGKEGDTP